MWTFVSGNLPRVDRSSSVGGQRSGVTVTVTCVGQCVGQSVRSGDDGGSVVRNGDRGSDVLDDGRNSSESVSFLDGIGKVASQTVGVDDGAVVARSTDQSRCWDESSLAGNQTSQQNCQL